MTDLRKVQVPVDRPPRCIKPSSERAGVFEFPGESQLFVAHPGVSASLTLREICLSGDSGYRNLSGI